MYINIKRHIKEVINEDKHWPLCLKINIMLYSVFGPAGLL